MIASRTKWGGDYVTIPRTPHFMLTSLRVFASVVLFRFSAK